jgi:hypothetical protein
MNSYLAKSLCLVATLLLLLGPGQQTAHAQSVNASGIMQTSLFVGGVDANVALADEFELRKALESYLDPGPPACPSLPGPPSLGKLIAEIRACNAGPPAVKVPGLTGLGGALGLSFLDRADNALAGGHFNKGARVVISFHGQITDYEFTETGTTDMGSGKLEVTTYITWRVVTPGSGNPAPKTEAYKWKILVINDGFKVATHSGDDDNPFPGTGLTFSEEMTDRIKSLGFTRKLWAKGDKIIIDEIRHKRWNSAAFSSPLDSSDPKYARLFEIDSESCIDMLFVGDPPATFAGLQGPPTYCLGRCANPPIINTGI